MTVEYSPILISEVSNYWIGLDSPPATVLDLGANVGAFSALAASAWPAAKIIAYEPIRENADIIRESLDRVEVHQKAVRGFAGSGDMFLGDGPLTSSFYQLGRQTDKKYRVEIVDAASIPSCEFVKIDTEGCEVEILERLDLSATVALAIEHHSHSDRDTIIRICLERGFRIVGVASSSPTGIVRFLRKKESPAKKSVFIGMPVYGGVDPHFFKCAMRLVAEFSSNTSIMPWIGDSLIPRARNAITSRFLDTDCTHLLMLDSDLIFGPEHITRILNRNVDVVGGFYVKKSEGKVCLVSNSFAPAADPTSDGLVKMKYMGTGFLLVARKVFEAMIKAYRDEIEYRPDEQTRTEWDFWRVGVYKFPDGTKRYLSEDWYFCQRCLDLGFDVWGDTHIALKHSGNAIFPLSYQEKDFFKVADAPA